MYIEQLREMVPPPSQNTVAVCNRIMLLIPYYISSMLVTLLKIIYAAIQVSEIVDLTVSSKLIKFTFQIYLLFCT
jgi:hypothetical protein